MDELTRYFIATSPRLRYLTHYGTREQSSNTEATNTQPQIDGAIPDTARIEQEIKMNDSSGSEDKKKNAIDKYFENFKIKFYEVRDDPKFLLEAAAAVIGLIVLGIYSCQLNQMIEANTINRESVEYAQRPFLTPHPLKIVPDVRRMGGDIIRSYIISATWQNTGNTPAIRVFKFINGAENAEPTEDQFIGQKPIPGGIMPVVIAARADEDGPTKLIEPESFLLGNLVNIPPEQRKGGNLDHNTFVWGWAAYRDVFPKTKVHVSEFCWKTAGIGFSASDPNAAPTFDFQSCNGRGYCIDEQCKDYEDIASLAK